jgi:hypothetical protein
VAVAGRGFRSSGAERASQPGAAFEHQRVHEGLWQVAAQPGRAGRPVPERAVRYLEHQVMLLTRPQRQAQGQSAAGARPPGAGAAHVTGPAHVQGAEPGVPVAEVVPVEGLQPRPRETGPGVQHDVDLRRSLPRDDTAEHHDLMGVPREREASRHSMMAPQVIQRLRQMRVPGS